VQGPGRLDSALLARLREDYPALTRSELRELFRAGRVRLGTRAVRASEELGTGSHRVTIEGWDPTPSASARARAAPSCELPIVFEDEELLVLHKASGMASAPLRADDLGTAVSSALARDSRLPPGPGARGGLEPGLLHRLDTGTSGLLAFARTPSSFARLREEWKGGGVRKFYRAVCARAAGAKTSALPEPGLVIDFPLAHDASSSRKMLALHPERSGFTRRQARGRWLEARTTLRGSRAFGDGRAELSLELHTGLMHQIRCHLSAIGWPIVGDDVYGGIPGPRLWLHAEGLSLPLKSGGRLELRAALPIDWPA
jgi:23S rRNA pseudouridine1911/1915/1917 synthase